MAGLDRATVYGLRAVTWLAGLAVSGAPMPVVASERGRLGELADFAAPIATRGLELIWQGLDQQPSLMLAGAVASAVPLVGATAALMRAMGRRARRRAVLRDLSVKGPPTAGHRPNFAWLQVENRGIPPLRLGELARIGCSQDCDLAIGGSGVAEIHALIQRTPDSEFIIFDVSDAGNGGLAVNGQPARKCNLRDGDRIEIGSARVVFHAKWMSRAGERPAAA